MTRSIRTLATLALLGASTTMAVAGVKPTPRSDTSVAANSIGSDAGLTKHGRYSNWPALPERQAGSSYRALVHTTFGVRERNFESGR